MDFSAVFSDDRLLANLVGIHLVLIAIFSASVLLRRGLSRGGDTLVRWTGLHWLDGLSREASKGARTLLFWSTVALMITAVVSTFVYHFSGHDIRTDLGDWYHNLTAKQLLAFAVLLGQLVALALGVSLAFRLIRRGRLYVELNLHRHVPRMLHCAGAASAESPAHTERHTGHAPPSPEEMVRHWVQLLERFALAAVFLGGVWAAGRAIGFVLVDAWAGLLLRILAILTVARLLTLSARTFSHLLTALGDRHLDHGHLRRYWERVKRLVPFGERCFEAAVWVSAASLCVRELEFIAFVAHYGAASVKCIAIFFGTRVLIELLTVFLNEAFGMYEEDRPIDQKGQTLVPLLQSICQYTLYFGSVLMMLRVFEIDTTPILAGAGIVGLAGGLGAQSLVTDVVSGFFILFENQYLVGDIVKIGDANGCVEAVSIRHTQIRDDQGKLVIIPNGQIKTVVNYSKGYVNAVVDVKISTSANLEQITRQMTEAGRRLRERHVEVLDATEIKGLVDLTPSDMVVRAVTRVQPGTHQAMELEYRRLLKEVFERAQAAAAAADSANDKAPVLAA